MKYGFRLNNLIESTYEIPNLNQLRYGYNFETDKYSDYKLSLLAVKYLFDTLDFDDFKKLIRDTDKNESYGSRIVNDALKWYNKNGCNNLRGK